MSRLTVSPAWKEYERFVAGLYSGADRVRVQHDITIRDADGSDRQIDGLVTVDVGPHQFRVLIECKSAKRRVERGDVDKLLMTRSKLNADKAVLFSSAGFQSGAINTAKANGIRLFHTSRPKASEWWPSVATRALVQVWSLRLENRVSLPWPEVGILTQQDAPFPKGIKGPDISFHPTRTRTDVIGNEKSLEDMLEDAAYSDLVDTVSEQIGVIANGRDCVGHFTVEVNPLFVGNIHIFEPADPPTVLKVPRVKFKVAVRVEQRSIEWASIDRLHDAVIATDAGTGVRYQVSQPSSDAPWTWADLRALPLGATIGTERRLVITSKDFFRPECFERPWSTFGKVNIYEIDEVPQSKTIGEVCGMLSGPPEVE